MFQGAGTPHYPYGPPHQPGFNDNNAMNGQPPFHPYGPPRQPGFNGNNGSNATNGPDDKCFEVGCNWTSTQSSGKRIQSVRAKFLDHYTSKHAPEAYKKRDAPFQDDTCKMGFRSKATLFYHILGGSGAKGKLHSPSVPCHHRDGVLKEFNAGANIRFGV
jgi:hypothetical protein